MLHALRLTREIALTALVAIAALAAPTEAAAAVQLVLSWTDNSGDETGFAVERGNSASGPFAEIGEAPANGASYTDTTVSAGTTYCYRVRAFNDFGYSDYTDPACATVTATYSLAVLRMGAGSGTVTSAPVGISCGSSCSGTYTGGTTVTLTASAASDSTFSGWSGGGCSGTGSCAVTLTAATTVTASFAANPAQVTLTASVAGTGQGTISSSTGPTCGTSCSWSYPSGTAVTLTASPAAGSIFSGWSGACSGTGTCSVTLTASTGVQATFVPQPVTQYTLMASVAGTGKGTIGASGGATCAGSCSWSYPSGTALTLTATPDANSVFSGWSGACSGTGNCTVTLTASKSVTATFAPKPVTSVTLSVNVSGRSRGTVVSSPTGINCGGTCSVKFPKGTAVTLTATPTTGNVFKGWSGGGCSGTQPCTITLNGKTTVYATFGRR